MPKAAPKKLTRLEQSLRTAPVYSEELVDRAIEAHTQGEVYRKRKRFWTQYLAAADQAGSAKTAEQLKKAIVDLVKNAKAIEQLPPPVGSRDGNPTTRTPLARMRAIAADWSARAPGAPSGVGQLFLAALDDPGKLPAQCKAVFADRMRTAGMLDAIEGLAGGATSDPVKIAAPLRHVTNENGPQKTDKPDTKTDSNRKSSTYQRPLSVGARACERKFADKLAKGHKTTMKAVIEDYCEDHTECRPLTIERELSGVVRKYKNRQKTDRPKNSVR